MGQANEKWDVPWLPPQDGMWAADMANDVIKHVAKRFIDDPCDVCEYDCGFALAMSVWICRQHKLGDGHVSGLASALMDTVNNYKQSIGK